jgi:3-keto steroid reductase
MSFSSIDYRLMIRQMLTAGLRRVLTLPRYLIANVGERSVDKLGWVWQCNVFAHYALVRELASVLRAAARSGGPARVIWVSSLEASAMGYDPDDWQLLRTPNTYALSKFQMDLVTTRLDVQAAAATADGAHDVTRHFIFQPGVVSTNIAAKQVSSIQALATSFSFLLVSPFYDSNLNVMSLMVTLGSLARQLTSYRQSAHSCNGRGAYHACAHLLACALSEGIR